MRYPMRWGRALGVSARILPAAAMLCALLSALGQGPAARADDASTLAHCPVEGDARNATVRQLNVLKRRMTLPLASDLDSAVTMTALTAPGDDASRWSEEKAATLEAYVAGVKVGGIESVNCHTHQAAYRDTHIELTLKPNDNDESTYVIVEVTPQMRAKMAQGGIDWSTSALRRELLGRWIRVTGWLLFDAEHAQSALNTHPDGGEIWRATAWEIHPITAIDVLPAKPQIVP
jgi:hypothetical protein